MGLVSGAPGRSPPPVSVPMSPFARATARHDYLVLDRRTKMKPAASCPPARSSESAIRNRGVGSDGILLRVASVRADFGLRIFQP